MIASDEAWNSVGTHFRKYLMNIWFVNLLRVIRNFQLREPFWSEIWILNCVNRLEWKRELHLQYLLES